jgi:MFS family permease
MASLSRPFVTENTFDSEADSRLPVAARWTLGSVLITNVGNGMQQLCVGKMLYDQTGSIMAYGGVFIFEFLINFVVQIVAGPIVDRHVPKTIIVVTDLIRGLAVILASVLIGLGLSANACIFASILAINIGKPFYRSATFTVGPTLISGKGLIRYNAFYDGFQQGGQLLGIVLVGILLNHVTPIWPFVLNGLTFIIAAGFVSIATIPKTESKRWGEQAMIKAISKDWWDIFLILKNTPSLCFHMLMTAMECNAVVFLELLLVPMVKDWQHENSYWLSAYGAGFGIGAVFGAGFMSQVIHALGFRRSAWLGQAGQAACFLALGYFHHPVISCVLIIIFGVLNTLSYTSLVSTLQARCVGPIKGRIVAVRNLATGITGFMVIPVITWSQKSSTQAALWSASFILGLCAISSVVLGSHRMFGARFLAEKTRQI